jgi:hypothetical protein
LRARPPRFTKTDACPASVLALCGSVLLLAVASAALAQDEPIAEPPPPAAAEAAPTPPPAAPAAEPEAKPAPKPAPKAQPAPRPAAPRPAPAPRATPAPRAAPAPAAAPAQVSDKWQERLDALHAQLATALKRKPLNGNELETLCTAWQSPKLYELDPLLDARLKVCSGRAAILRERLDQASWRLDKGLAAAQASAAPEARALEAEARLLLIDLRDQEAGDKKTCGGRLGLEELRQWEAWERSRRHQTRTAELSEIVSLDVQPWSNRALLRIAREADAFYREVALTRPPSYRGFPLPSPLLVSTVDEASVVQQQVGPGTAWPKEIARLYDVAERNLRRAGDVGRAEAAAQARAALLKVQVPKEQPTTNPLVDEAPIGVIRFAPHPTDPSRPRFEQRTAAGFAPLPDEQAVPLLQEQALSRMPRAADAEPEARVALTVQAAWAIAALAEAGELKPNESVFHALEDERWPVRFLVLRAIEVQPTEEAYGPLVAHVERLVTQKGWDNDAYDKRFHSLSAALFGEEERTLLALREVINKERSLLTKVTYEKGLPWDERAFLIAEQGDSRARYRVQELISVGDDRTGAIALYGFYKTQGTRSLWVLRQHRSGRMGCVAQALLRLETEKGKRLSLDPNSSLTAP